MINNAICKFRPSSDPLVGEQEWFAFVEFQTGKTEVLAKISLDKGGYWAKHVATHHFYDLVKSEISKFGVEITPSNDEIAETMERNSIYIQNSNFPNQTPPTVMTLLIEDLIGRKINS